ncbi:hypothetical protein BABINDRAFT_13531 [Babjeviella inositovora NRRL Y-12698]|uniref:Malate dehydrogenase n=1 Tax=Babjeviella inositovora NRRL Y-12698 TaxID=984486 RepID=A0A1E3QQG5_9ASCO|nr:uncharacterized protein BABINDRAFT_13531 [Babjeviella inositovora NRRL Y-12698]ODQ79936.1 hypothetical protein BABINDRAFT_13531 [Babjeviella inositovora NRRL Y-12698]
MKVTVCGAAGGIGQPLSLLLKLNPKITQLSLYDVVNAPGVGADLSHISTPAETSAFVPGDKNDGLAFSLKGSQIVIIPAGVPRKPGMTRDDLFNINAGIVKTLAEGVAEYCPDAFVLVISNPVNSTVPIFASVLKAKGVFNPRKVLGVTTLDIVRANTFISTLTDANVSNINVPVIGGHSGETIVPVFSVGTPSLYAKLDADAKAKLVHRVQFGGDEVVQAKNGAGSATLSMAYAGYKLAERIIEAITGASDVVECTFVYLDESIAGAKEARAKLGGELDFVSLPVKFGAKGVEEIKYQILDQLNDEEKALFEIAKVTLKGNVAKGVSFVEK